MKRNASSVRLVTKRQLQVRTGTQFILFLLGEALGISLLTDPSLVLERGGVLRALVGVDMLAVDVVLTVPSSLIMIAYGALFSV